VRILFRKISDERHTLAIERSPGAREEVECETRSYLVHDLLHYAVESEAGLETGFWGRLAAGKTLADMNDRTGASMADKDASGERGLRPREPIAGGAGPSQGPANDESPELGAIEQVVGALHGSTKGIPAGELVAGITRFAASLGVTMPSWLTEAFVVAVQERMRRLQGHWRATPFGGVMELGWPGAELA
jgi:hypothetical protein